MESSIPIREHGIKSTIETKPGVRIFSVPFWPQHAMLALEGTRMVDKEPAAKKNQPLRPRQETKEQMKPITRDSFLKILKRAITPPAPKPAPKST